LIGTMPLASIAQDKKPKTSLLPGRKAQPKLAAPQS
jgi:hypothetical protein